MVFEKYKDQVRDAVDTVKNAVLLAVLSLAVAITALLYAVFS